MSRVHQESSIYVEFDVNRMLMEGKRSESCFLEEASLVRWPLRSKMRALREQKGHRIEVEIEWVTIKKLYSTLFDTALESISN